ncbi:glycosyltransferase [Shewanella surugensis]|uniref:Glycosyltransferase n=1 Tax=Shewanella surugensis TaxID=212020 RepID=A0ABT0LBZ8_9GAMM|nr:glycosyltransferase [Shewanella surugensis]MCL1125165.1 glycosyltransferase [Shewanella surugensis]
MRPKVLHLIDDSHFGGIQSAIQRLSASRLKNDFEFQIQRTNLKERSFGNYQTDILCVHHALSWQSLPKILSLKLRHFRTPLLYQEHHYCDGFMKHQVSNQKRFLLMLKLSYCLMNKVIAVSDHQAQWIIQNNLVNTKKLIMLGQSSNLTPLVSLPVKKAQSNYVFGAYGRLHKQKGFDMLIEAIKLIPHANITLKIVGSGELEYELRKLASPLTNIHFVGFCDDISAFLNECDAIIIPSRWEPFGLIFQEALAAGKPILHSGVDGLLEQSKIIHPQYKEGLFKQSAESIANALLHCIKNPPKILKPEQRNQLLAKWEDTLNQWKSLFRDFINKKNNS